MIDLLWFTVGNIVVLSGYAIVSRIRTDRRVREAVDRAKQELGPYRTRAGVAAPATGATEDMTYEWRFERFEEQRLWNAQLYYANSARPVETLWSEHGILWYDSAGNERSDDERVSSAFRAMQVRERIQKALEKRT